jgi:hypothetical protein
MRIHYSLFILLYENRVMSKLTIGIFLLVAFACKPLILTPEITNRECYRLYRQAAKGDSTYIIKYNPDSTYALCILNDNSELAAEPISFFIVDITTGEKALVSINQYHKAKWIDNEHVLLTTYLGIGNLSRGIKKKPGSNFNESIFNVISKRIESYKSETEK